ncbi:hypothetical protein Tco_0023797, partial [Tanacetum coccineum]
MLVQWEGDLGFYFGAKKLYPISFEVISSDGFPDHYFKYAAYNELPPWANVATAILT